MLMKDLQTQQSLDYVIISALQESAYLLQEPEEEAEEDVFLNGTVLNGVNALRREYRQEYAQT